MSDGMHLKELNSPPILMVEGRSRDTVFYDSNGDEYLRIGADNVPADVYERFTSWCMHLPPVHDAEVRRLTDENEKLKREVDTAEKQSLDFYVEKENAALKDSIKEITITVDDCCEINAQHYSHDQAIEQDYALSTIRQELLKLKDKGSDV